MKAHVRVNHPQLFAAVHDGPGRSVVFLANYSDKDIKDVPMEVLLPSLAQSVFSARSGPLEFTPGDGSAIVLLGLAREESDILVCKY